jgi:hypothetical protein
MGSGDSAGSASWPAVRGTRSLEGMDGAVPNGGKCSVGEYAPESEIYREIVANRQCQSGYCKREIDLDKTIGYGLLGSDEVEYRKEEGVCEELKEVGSPCEDKRECRGYCDNTCKPYKEAGEACEGWYECKGDKYGAEGACGRLTADDGAALVCCPSGETSMYGGYYYCTAMAIGATCWSDAQCETGKCKGNLGGLQRGTCSSVTKAVGEVCDSNYECANKACGRSTADDGAALVCCPSGATSTYAGYDYCTGMAVGATCWADDQCQSKYCQGNAGGLQRGNCQSTSKSKGESCSKDAECGSKACGRLTAADNAPLVCCDALESWAGYDYCNNMPAGSVCWTDDQCVSSASNCKGNGYGIQRGICS